MTRKKRAAKPVSKKGPKTKQAIKTAPVKTLKKAQKPASPKKPKSRPSTAQSREYGVLFILFAVVFIVGAVLFIVANQRRAGLVDSLHPSDLVSDLGPFSTSEESVFAYAGLPVNHTGEPLLILTNKAYIVGYSEKRHDPLWVAYRFDKAPIKKDYSRHSGFMVDDRTSSRVKHADYTNSGFDRGHMAPSYGIAECYGDEAMVETYLMSNIAPQTPSLNQKIWRNLESTIVREYADEFETVWVITGPIFDSKIERLDSGVEIPDAFFKIVADEKDGGVRMLGFIIPQNAEPGYPPGYFLASIDEIEGQTGLDFFSLLTDELENLIELRKEELVW